MFKLIKKLDFFRGNGDLKWNITMRDINRPPLIYLKPKMVLGNDYYLRLRVGGVRPTTNINVRPRLWRKN